MLSTQHLNDDNAGAKRLFPRAKSIAPRRIYNDILCETHIGNLYVIENQKFLLNADKAPQTFINQFFIFLIYISTTQDSQSIIPERNLNLKVKNKLESIL